MPRDPQSDGANGVPLASERIDAPPTDALIQNLHQKNLTVRFRAADILVNIGCPVVKPVVRVLQSDEPVARRLATWIIEAIGSPSLPDLIFALE